MKPWPCNWLRNWSNCSRRESNRSLRRWSSRPSRASRPPLAFAGPEADSWRSRSRKASQRPSALRWRRVMAMPSRSAKAGIRPGTPRFCPETPRCGSTAGAAKESANEPLQARLSGPHSQSSSWRAARSSRIRPCSKSKPSREGEGCSRHSAQRRSSALICQRPVVNNHCPSPITAGAGGSPALLPAEACAGAISSTRPPAKRVATASRSCRAVGASNKPCTGSCSKGKAA